MAKTLKILCANGVNLDLLGTREPVVYGTANLKDLEAMLRKELATYAKAAKIDLVFFQTNDEAEMLKTLSDSKADGILINPAAWTHTSVALADRLKGLGIPFVEVHISNISAREEYRKQSYSASAAAGVVYGFGLDSYLIGLLGLIRTLTRP